MTLRRLLVLLVVALPLAIGSPIAQAATDGHADTERDVRVFPISGNGVPKGPTTDVPNRVHGDIWRIRVNHSDTKVNVYILMTQIDRKGELHSYDLRFRTGKIERIAHVKAYPDQWPGTKVTLFRPDGKSVACPGVSRVLDYRANSAIITIPTACLGKPQWVRVAATVSQRIAGKLYFDQAYATGGKFGTPVYGPRIGH